jgi:hypothetical protein
MIEMCRAIGVARYVSLTCDLAYLTYTNVCCFLGRNGLDKFMSSEMMMRYCGKGRTRTVLMIQYFAECGGPVPVRPGRNGAQILADL